MIDKEIVESLRISREVIGEVNPIIEDWDGEVLSGHHRKQAGWTRAHKVDSRELAKKWGVTPLMAKDMVRLHLNLQRRPSREETQFLVRRMALCLKDMGVPKDRIASELYERRYVPYSRSYILELLPEEWKQVEKAPKPPGGDVPLVEHPGQPAAPFAEKREETAPNTLTLSSSTVEVHEYKPPERWEDRRARMEAPVSRMEQAVYLALQSRGVGCEFQRDFCVQSTRPDLYFPGRNLVVYIDGAEVHEGREDRDEALRELLTKRYGLQVVSLTYESFTEAAKEMVLNQILELIKEGA